MLGLSAVWLASLGGTAPPALAATTTVNFVGWGGPEEKEVIATVIKQFEAKNPDVKIKYTQIPGGGYDYFNKVRLMIVGGLAPDVFYVPDGNFGELASRNVLMNLDPFIAKSKTLKTADIWESALVRYRWNGKQVHKGSQYCLPKDIGPFAMYYNKDLLKKMGVPFPDPHKPMTWDQAIAFWKRLSYKDNKKIQHYGVSGYQYESAVLAMGASMLSDDKQTWTLDSPKAIQAVQWVADLALVHKVAPDAAKTAAGTGSSSPTQLFESGLAACHFDGRYMVPRFRSMSFDWDVAPIPVPRAGMKSIACSGSVGFGIYAKSRKADASYRFIEYLSGPEGQSVMTKTGFQVPNQRWLAKSDVYRQPGLRPAHPEVFLAAAETSKPWPASETPNNFWHDVMWNFLPKVFRGERKAADLLPEAAPLINQTLRENNRVVTK